MHPSEMFVGAVSWLFTLCQRLKHQGACWETTACLYGYKPNDTGAYSNFSLRSCVM